jgi:hypothetical protein
MAYRRSLKRGDGLTRQRLIAVVDVTKRAGRAYLALECGHTVARKAAAPVPGHVRTCDACANG